MQKKSNKMDTHQPVEGQTTTFSSRIKSFDFYRKLPQDISEKSSSGGLGRLFSTFSDFFFSILEIF